MKILVDNSFVRDSKKLPIQVQKQVKKIIQELAGATSPKDVKLSKIAGGKNAYRISLGNYRIGIYLEYDPSPS